MGQRFIRGSVLTMTTRATFALDMPLEYWKEFTSHRGLELAAT